MSIPSSSQTPRRLSSISWTARRGRRLPGASFGSPFPGYLGPFRAIPTHWVDLDDQCQRVSVRSERSSGDERPKPRVPGRFYRCAGCTAGPFLRRPRYHRSGQLNIGLRGAKEKRHVQRHRSGFGVSERIGAILAEGYRHIAAATQSERRVAAVWQTAPDGKHDSGIDGTPRVGAWHSLPDWGAVITSSVDKEAVLAPWRQSQYICTSK